MSINQCMSVYQSTHAYLLSSNDIFLFKADPDSSSLLHLPQRLQEDLQIMEHHQYKETRKTDELNDWVIIDDAEINRPIIPTLRKSKTSGGQVQQVTTSHNISKVELVPRVLEEAKRLEVEKTKMSGKVNQFSANEVCRCYCHRKTGVKRSSSLQWNWEVLLLLTMIIVAFLICILIASTSPNKRVYIFLHYNESSTENAMCVNEIYENEPKQKPVIVINGTISKEDPKEALNANLTLESTQINVSEVEEGNLEDNEVDEKHGGTIENIVEKQEEGKEEEEHQIHPCVIVEQLLDTIKYHSKLYRHLHPYIDGIQEAQTYEWSQGEQLKKECADVFEALQQTLAESYFPPVFVVF